MITNGLIIESATTPPPHHTRRGGQGESCPAPSKHVLAVTVCEFRRWSEAPPESNVCQSEHVALMTTCITLALCHPNSEPHHLPNPSTSPSETRAPWHRDNSATPPPPTQTPCPLHSPAPCPPFQRQYVLLVAKTNHISLQHLCCFCSITLLGPVQVRCLGSLRATSSPSPPSPVAIQV